MSEDPYRTLDVSKDASDAEIKRAYRKLARQYHPDRNPGDAAAEEDYVLGAIGWASTKKLPLLVIIEDNNFSILTEKNVRRNWEIQDVAKAFKMKGFNLDDNPKNIYKYSKYFFKEPCLLNINTL